MTQNIQDAYKKEKPRLLNFIRQRVRSLEDAEDILQDVFTQTLMGVSVTEPIENILGWFYTAARRKIIDYYRQKRRRDISLDEHLEDWTLKELAAEGGTPEHHLSRSLLAEALAEALDELPENQRRAFTWHVLDGFSFQEMADRSGESVNTWISRKRYAILYLRDRLKSCRDILTQY